MKKVRVLFLCLLSLMPFALAAQETSKEKEPAAPNEAVKKPEKYNLPLFFYPEDVGVKKLAYELSWNLSGKSLLKMATLSLDADSFLPIFYAGNSPTHPLKIAGEPGADKDSLFLIWPTNLIPSGNIEIISRTGAVLWSESFSTKDVKKWQKQVTQKRLNTSEEKQKENKAYFASGVVLTDLKADLLNQLKESFRFCLSLHIEKNRSMLCTPRYTISKGEGAAPTLARVVETVEARVLVDRDNAALQGSKPVQPNQVISFFAQTSSGSSFEFITKVLPLNIFDIFKDKDGAVLVSGTDPVPHGAGIYESKNDDENFWNSVGWQQTIGDVRNYWQMSLPPNKEISFPGEAGGIFRLQLDYAEVPTYLDRAWISNRDTPVTYSEHRVLHLFPSEKQKLQALSPNEISEDTNAPGASVWKFYAPKLADYNRSTIDILKGNKTTKGSYEIFRGYSSELSGRMTGVLVADMQTAFLGEVSYNKWFQNILGWDNDRWSHLRWGLSTRYFKNITPINLRENSSSTTISPDQATEFSTLSVNLKYRFTPGLWARDETWGLTFGAQSVSISGVNAPLMGGGFFWARSMPRVFNDLFEFAPFMKYPKFVDMEFNIYPSSLSQSVTATTAYNINFHGKILWTQTFFGEAGFGLTNYSLADKEKNLAAESKSFYGTAGIGLNF